MWGETLETIRTWPRQRPGTIVPSVPLADCLRLAGAAAVSVAAGSEPVSVADKKCEEFLRSLADAAADAGAVSVAAGGEPVSVAGGPCADLMLSVAGAAAHGEPASSSGFLPLASPAAVSVGTASEPVSVAEQPCAMADAGARGEPASSSGEPESSSVKPVSVVANSDSPAGELQSQQARVDEVAASHFNDPDCDYDVIKQTCSDDESETPRPGTDATAGLPSVIGSG
jgi:hypothetical protein